MEKAMTKAWTGLGALVTLASLGGCAGHNETNKVGPGRTVEALTEIVERPDMPLRSDGKSVTSLDRSAWGVVVYELPPDRLGHRPTYADPYRWTEATARQRGDALTPGNALELSGETLWTQRQEAAASPFMAVWDLLRMPWRLYETPPGTSVRGGTMTYWRGGIETLRAPSLAEETTRKAEREADASASGQQSPGTGETKPTEKP